MAVVVVVAVVVVGWLVGWLYRIDIIQAKGKACEGLLKALLSLVQNSTLH